MPTTVLTEADIAANVHRLVQEADFSGAAPLTPESKPFWQGLRGLGSELWLDSGDRDAVAGCWSGEFSALTTNNTLLNKEVQKGLYDGVIKEAARQLAGLDRKRLVTEIACLLNGRHAMMLAHTFNCLVSVEEHTDLADNIESAVSYGKRLHDMNPDRFIIKLPWTPAGLIATRQLRKTGIPVNLTLGFSARQNYIAAAFCGPTYVNVFLGRLNAYFADNKLSDGRFVGEKATLASQKAIKSAKNGKNGRPRQIAASLRDAQQVKALAGVDALTIPTKVAEEATRTLSGAWESQLGEGYEVTLNDDVDSKSVRAGVLWDIDKSVRSFADAIVARPPATAADLVATARSFKLNDLFPEFSKADIDKIGAEGKIPKHASWAGRIANKELAIDSLLNMAGLRSFAKDQAELDDRIRKTLGT